MIWLQASALAGIIGEHRYVPQHEAVLELWERHDPDCAALLREAGMRTASQRKRKAARDVARDVQEVAQLSSALSSGDTVANRTATETVLEAAVERSASSPRTRREPTRRSSPPALELFPSRRWSIRHF